MQHCFALPLCSNERHNASHYNAYIVMNKIATGQCDHNIYCTMSISRLMFMIMSHDLGGHLKLHGSEQVTELQLVIA